VSAAAEADWQGDWHEVARPRLLAVKGVARAVAGGGRERARALRRLAADPSFADVRSDPNAETRGEQLRAAVLDAAQTVAQTAVTPAARTAARLWCRYLTTGESIELLARPRADWPMPQPPETKEKARYLLGLSRFGPTHGQPTVYQHLTELVAGLRDVAAPDGRLGRRRVAGAWDRLLWQQAALTLLRVLAIAAPDPLPLSLLDGSDGRFILPPALRTAPDAKTRPAVQAAEELVRLGLVIRSAAHGTATLALVPGVRAAVLERTSREEQKDLHSRVLRLLRVTLPNHPADPDDWQVWELHYPHVVAVAAVALNGDDRPLLQAAGELLNAASVYSRFGTGDSDAPVRHSQDALRAMTKADKPEMEEFNAALVNAAAASRISDHRVGLLRLALEHRQQHLPGDDAVLLGTRLAYASALADHGDYDQARNEYDDLLADVHGNYIETMHDYATFLLDEIRSQRSPQRDADLTRAIGMLQEVRVQTGPGQHGYWQATLNWADALVLSGRAQEAERPVRDLLDYTTRHHPGGHIEIHVRATLQDVVDVTQPPDRERLEKQLWDLDDEHVAQARCKQDQLAQAEDDDGP
jgi:hypothetical protein